MLFLIFFFSVNKNEYEKIFQNCKNLEFFLLSIAKSLLHINVHLINFIFSY